MSAPISRDPRALRVEAAAKVVRSRLNKARIEAAALVLAAAGAVGGVLASEKPALRLAGASLAAAAAAGVALRHSARTVAALDDRAAQFMVAAARDWEKQAAAEADHERAIDALPEAQRAVARRAYESLATVATDANTALEAIASRAERHAKSPGAGDRRALRRTFGKGA